MHDPEERQMPNLAEMVEKFEAWWESGDRVQVDWQGFAAVEQDQRVMKAQVDGRVMSVQALGEITEVTVFCPASQNNLIQLRLSAGCTFQTMTLPTGEAFANLESLIRIVFPTGEYCFVQFFHPPN